MQNEIIALDVAEERPIFIGGPMDKVDEVPTTEAKGEKN